MNKRIRVLICDDHDMLREGLSVFLRTNDDLELIGEASSGVDAINLCAELSPDIVLMDLLMPEIDGIAAIKKIQEHNPDTRIIALSSFSDRKLVRAAIDVGVTGYLLKNVSAETLAESIRVVYSGVATFSPEITHVLFTLPAESDRNIQLTNREADVLSLMVEGYSNGEIAFQLDISKFTIKNHVSNILGKLNVSSRTEAVRVAIQNDLVMIA